MDTFSAFVMGEATRGNRKMVFDWDKAATILRDRKAKTGYAGLRSDLEWTGGYILRDGKIDKESYTYLASTWATPILIVDGNMEEDCWKYMDECQWDSKTKWPESAVAIFNGDKMPVS